MEIKLNALLSFLHNWVTFIHSTIFIYYNLLLNFYQIFYINKYNVHSRINIHILFNLQIIWTMLSQEARSHRVR